MKKSHMYMVIGAVFVLTGVGISLATGQNLNDTDHAAGVLAVVGFLGLVVGGAR